MTVLSPRPVTATPGQQVVPAYNARDLTLDVGQAQIILDEQVYTLRITRAGKLILTK